MYKLLIADGEEIEKAEMYMPDIIFMYINIPGTIVGVTPTEYRDSNLYSSKGGVCK